MEDLVSFWSYQEIVDELQRKLLYTTLELESVRMEADEEIKKNKENVRNLLHLLRLANQERDEAREEIQKLMNNLMPTPISMALPPSGSDLPKTNSCITDSNSFFESNGLISASSPTDSFFNGVSSPLFSNSSMADSSNLDFDSLLKGKTLPQKGKLLQAVVGAGPLLQTLLLAGPLPRWRNPPPNQLFKIPQVSINHKADSEPNLEISRGSSQMCSASMLNFSKFSSSGSCFENVNSQILSRKRQRFH